MPRMSWLPALVIAAGLVFASGAADAKTHGPQGPKPRVTRLLNTELVDLAGKEANVVLFSYPPGFVGPRHSHPGHVFVYVTEGTMIIDLEGKGPKMVERGGVFHEAPNTVMRAENASVSEPLRFVVFQLGDKGLPLMRKAK